MIILLIFNNTQYDHQWQTTHNCRNWTLSICRKCPRIVSAHQSELFSCLLWQRPTRWVEHLGQSNLKTVPFSPSWLSDPVMPEAHNVSPWDRPCSAIHEDNLELVKDVQLTITSAHQARIFTKRKSIVLQYYIFIFSLTLDNLSHMVEFDVSLSGQWASPSFPNNGIWCLD